MTRDHIREQIALILRDLLQNAAIVLNDNTVAYDVDGWDSVVQMKLLIAIEAGFGIRFDTDEIDGFTDVGNLVDGVARRAA